VVDASHFIVTPGDINAHIDNSKFPLRGIGAGWASSRDYHANMHQNLAALYAARDMCIANMIGALNQIQHGTTTIMDWCHILKDAEMTNAAVDTLDESGTRAVFGRGTVKPPVTSDTTPYYKIPFARDGIHRLRTGRFASDDKKLTLAMAILDPQLLRLSQ
jgi:5-methylthioadenosine/S-adenosylhomocysteine deaminase